MNARVLFAAVLIAATLGVAPGRAMATVGNICNPVTDAFCPNAIDDLYKTTVIATTPLQPLDVAAPGVLANDFGDNSTQVDVTQSDLVSFSGNATISWHSTTKGTGRFTYTPDPATPFTGVDTFGYEIVDGDGNFADATVSVEIDPIVKGESYDTPANTTLTVDAPGLLGNDIGVGDIADWDATSVHGGSVDIADDGSFEYVPKKGFSGADSFTYTVDDMNFDNEFTATVNVQVGPVNTPPPPPPVPPGYWMVGKSGSVYAFGQLANYGSSPTANVTHLEPTPTHHGYWIVNAAGHVFAHGDAKSYGNASGLATHERVSSLSSTFSGHGYWLFTDRGRVMPRGDAKFYGDLHAKHLNGPIVGSVATSNGKGYYMVGSDGGIFTFGNAAYHGSMGGRRLNKPVNGLVPNKTGTGYWLVASDGGIFAFNAPYRGSMGGTRLNRPVIGMVRYGNGYLMVGSDGGIFNFSNKAFVGSLGGTPPAVPIVGVATAG